MVVEIDPGGDWCAAAAAASPGDEIVLRAGDHAGPCTLGASGDDGAPVVVRGEPGAGVVYSGSSSNVIDVVASWLEIRDLAFGPTQANIDAIKVKSGDHVTVAGNTFTAIGGISVAANSADSVGIEIVGNTFLDLQATGIYLGCHDGSCAARDFLIAGNLVDGVTSSAVGYAVETKLDSHGVVRDNVISGTKGPGVEVYGSSDDARVTVVERNLVVGSQENASLEIGGGPAIVRNNVVVGGSTAAVLVYDYGGRGLVRGIHLLGNTAVGTDGPAFELTGFSAGADLVVRGNAAWQEAGAGPALPDPVAGVEWDGNVTCDATCFADGAAWDFSPAAALVGQGADDPELAEDFCGRARGSPPAAGALEGPLDAPLAVVDPADLGCPEPATTTGPTSPPIDPTTAPTTPTASTAPAETEGGPAKAGCGCAGTRGGGGLLAALAFALRPHRSGRPRVRERPRG